MRRSNPPAQDPTRTLTLRRQFIADVTRRLAGLKRDIRTSITERDALHLQPGRLVAAAAASPRQFAYSWDSQKVTAFMEWLRKEEQEGLLEVTRRPGAVGPEPWSNVYIRSAYQKGLAEGRSRLHQAVSAYANATPVSAAFYQPFHAQRVGLIYTRAFEALRGISAAMSSQMSQVLARGMAEGTGPYEIARRLTNRVDAIGIVRARTIARTEVVAAHNMASLGEYEQAESIIGDKVKVEWWTALDERVRSSHAARHGRIYTREEALPLLGEPNCRCTLLPVVEEPKKKQRR